MKASIPALYDKLAISSDCAQSFSWQKSLIRDIAALLNDASRSASLNLTHRPYCAGAVINYGLPSLSRQLPISVELKVLAAHIQNIITTFEPRIDPKSIIVIPIVDAEQPAVLALLFDIHGHCRLGHEDNMIKIRIALDYSCGTVQVI